MHLVSKTGAAVIVDTMRPITARHLFVLVAALIVGVTAF